MRRIALGIIGLLLLTGGIALALARLDASWANFTVGVLIKTGAVILLICLAYQQLVRLFEVVPPWMIGAGLLGGGAIIVYPKSLLVVLGLFAALLVLHFAGMFLKAAPGKKKPRGGKRRASSKSQISDFKSDIPSLKPEIPKSEVINHKL